MKKKIFSLSCMMIMVMLLCTGCGKQQDVMSEESKSSSESLADDKKDESLTETGSNEVVSDDKADKYSVEKASEYIQLGKYKSTSVTLEDYFEISYIEDDLMYLFLFCEDGDHIAEAYAVGRIEKADNEYFQYVVDAEYVDGWENHERLKLSFDCEKQQVSAKTTNIDLDPSAWIVASFDGYYKLTSSQVDAKREDYDRLLVYYPEGTQRREVADGSGQDQYIDGNGSDGYVSDPSDYSYVDDGRKYSYDLLYTGNEQWSSVTDVFQITDVYWDANYTYCKLAGVNTGLQGYIFFDGYYTFNVGNYFGGNLNLCVDKSSFYGNVDLYYDYTTAYNAVFLPENTGQQVATTTIPTPEEDGFTLTYSQYEYDANTDIYVIGNVDANFKPFRLVGINYLYYKDGYLYFSESIVNNDDKEHGDIQCEVNFYNKDMGFLESYSWATVYQLIDGRREDSAGRKDFGLDAGAIGMIDNYLFDNDDGDVGISIKNHNTSVRYIYIYIKNYR